MSARPGMASSVHAHDGAVDELGPVTGQKRRHTRDVVCGSNVPDRDSEITVEDVRFDFIPALTPASRLCLRVEPPLDFRCANQACSDGVDRYTATGQWLTQARRGVVQRGLCRGIAGHMGKGTQALATGDLDDPPPAGSLHVGNERLNQTNARNDIQLVIPNPFLSGTFEPGVLRIHARIVDEDVDRTERGFHFQCEPVDVGWNGEISGDEYRAPSGPRELIDQMLSALFFATMNYDRHVF